MVVAARADAREPDGGGAGGARRLGAVGDARSAQLGASGGRRGRRRQRGDRPGRSAGAGAAPVSPSAVAQPVRACGADAARCRRTRRGASPRSGRSPSRQPDGPLLASPEMPACYRHPSRETGVSCSSCGRPICPDCMTPTSVGMRCPECARDRTKVRTGRTLTSDARRHPSADRDQRDRVPRRDGVGGPVQRLLGSVRHRLEPRRPVRPVDNHVSPTTTGGSSPAASCTTGSSTSS